MKKMNKTVISVLLCLVLMLFTAGCGESLTPYETNNEDNYTVSVKYDANGGTFTTNTSIIVDSFNLQDIKSNSSNTAEIALISPDNSSRGTDAFSAVNSGYFLAGWYQERIETTDEAGNVSYSYSGKWDFEKDLLSVDTSKTYSSDEPIMTLYAAWVPMFEIEFYTLGSGEFIEEYKFDPTTTEGIKLPKWSEETGAVEMFNFPKKSGYTFKNAYYDAEGKNQISDEIFSHVGTIDYEHGVAVNSVMKLYLDFTEGEWYRIYNAEQFVESASLDGNYEIFADLDFENEIWPTVFMYGNFNGTIKGNGHTFKNIKFAQTNNSKVNAGLFGNLTESADISDLTFDNVTFTIKAGTRVVGTSYGLLAGTISGEAKIADLAIKNSTFQIDSSAYFGVDDYTIGLVCGMGDASVVSKADIDCEVVGDENKLSVSTNGNTVVIEFSND